MNLCEYILITAIKRVIHTFYYGPNKWSFQLLKSRFSLQVFILWKPLTAAETTAFLSNIYVQWPVLSICPEKQHLENTVNYN